MLTNSSAHSNPSAHSLPCASSCNCTTESPPCARPMPGAPTAAAPAAALAADAAAHARDSHMNWCRSNLGGAQDRPLQRKTAGRLPAGAACRGTTSCSSCPHASRNPDGMQAGTLDALGDSVLAEASNTGTLSETALSSLHFLYDTHLAKALQIVDQGGVTCFVGAGSGRKLYRVHGHAAESYLVFPRSYCSCQVRRRGAAGGASRRWWRRRRQAVPPPAASATCRVFPTRSHHAHRPSSSTSCPRGRRSRASTSWRRAWRRRWARHARRRCPTSRSRTCCRSRVASARARSSCAGASRAAQHTAAR